MPGLRECDVSPYCRPPARWLWLWQQQLQTASHSCFGFCICFCICLCSCSRGPIPQRQALRVKPHRGCAHGCARFFKGTGTSL
ncbi:hypothetical protein EIQ02_13360 [Xanthomonas campestris pv. raphani]